MATNLAIEPALIDRALSVSGEKTSRPWTSSGG